VAEGNVLPFDAEVATGGERRRGHQSLAEPVSDGAPRSRCEHVGDEVARPRRALVGSSVLEPVLPGAAARDAPDRDIKRSSGPASPPCLVVEDGREWDREHWIAAFSGERSRERESERPSGSLCASRARTSAASGARDSATCFVEAAELQLVTQRVYQSRRVAHASPAATERGQCHEHRPQPRSPQQGCEPLMTRSHRLARRKAWAAVSSGHSAFVGQRSSDH
jgi:hypothetical protein